MARVGDLLAAVGAPDRSEQRLPRAAASDGLAVGEQWRPERRALSVAGAAPVSVLLEQVERAAVAVDEDASQLRARDSYPGGGDDTARGARSNGGAVWPGGVRGAARR